MNIGRSIHEMLKFVSISFTDSVELKILFCKPNYNIVNELNDSNEPTLFFELKLYDYRLKFLVDRIPHSIK